jgi:hypothetical protein
MQRRQQTPRRHDDAGNNLRAIRQPGMGDDMKRSTGCGFAASLAALAFAASPAWANTVEETGETTGIAAYAPLPEGGYFLNLGNWGERDTMGHGGPNTAVGVDIPAIVWSTPYTILGARVELLVAQPLVEVDVDRTASYFGVYYPFIQPILAWDLGNGFSVGAGVGSYLPMKNELTHLIVGNVGTIRSNIGINYVANNLTARTAPRPPANTTGRCSTSRPITRGANGSSAPSVTARTISTPRAAYMAYPISGPRSSPWARWSAIISAR